MSEIVSDICVHDVDVRPGQGRLSTMLIVAVIALLLFTLGAYATVAAVERDELSQANALEEARLLAAQTHAVLLGSSSDATESALQILRDDTGVVIHILELDPVGMSSYDAYEREALEALSSDSSEYHGIASYEGAVCYRYVGLYADSACAISVIVPMQGYLDNHAHVISNYLGLFILLALELIACIGVALRKLISRPLEELSRAAHEVADGDLGGKLGSGIAFGEVARLKQDLDEMEARLKESHDELEDRVRERTSDLEHALCTLQEEVEYKTTFLSTMSHELRTPLASINAYADVWLSSYDGGDEDERTLVEGIKRNSKVLLETINNTLDAASIEAGRFVIDEVPFDLYDMVNTIEEVATPLAREKHISWTMQVDPDLPLVVLDPNVVHRICMNLVSNALKFCNEGGRVCFVLCANRSEGELVIEVSDTGIGIPAEDLSVIFERFRQADSSVSRRYGGSGLGLALVKEMCELMGGHVEVRSTVGQGSVFTVKLPMKVLEEN